MEIVVNGKTETLDKELSVLELLEKLDVAKVGTAIAINNQIVPRDSHANARISDGDRIEIIRPIGGG